jgi:outer membrane lipoprotein-sorting protein
MVPIHSHLAEENSGLKTFGLANAKSQRDSGSKPRVARNELPWKNAPQTDNPNGVAAWLCSLLLLMAMVSHAADYDAQFNKWFEVQTNLQSWSGDFTQTRTLTVLNMPLITPGKVWVKPGEFRWEIGQPVQTIVLRRPEELLIIYPRLKRAEKYALGAVPSGPMKDALSLMDASLPRDRASMEEHFRLVSAAVTNSILQMTLQPRSEAARKFIGQVVIGFHTNDYIIANTEMKFADGSTLQNTFTNIVLNQPLAADLFEATLPPDYTVAEPLKQ